MAFDQILKFFNKDPNEIMPGNSFESFKQSYISERNLHDGGIDQISELLKKVILEQSFTNLIIFTKLKYIYNGANGCYNNFNYLGLAYFTRAVLEHVATYAYIVKKTESSIDDLLGQTTPQSAIKVLQELSKNYNTFFYGTGNKNKIPGGSPNPIHINDAIKALDSYFGNVNDDLNKHSHDFPNYSFLFHGNYTLQKVKNEFGLNINPHPMVGIVHSDYDLLSDFVHPNYGSNFLVSSGNIAEGHIDVLSQNIRNVSTLFLKKCLRYWFYYNELKKKSLKSFFKLDAWLLNSYKQEAKPTRLFKLPNKVIIGDGKSPESAFAFPNARDKVEEWETFHDLCRKLEVYDYVNTFVDISKSSHIEIIKAEDGRVFYVKWSRTLKGLLF